MVCDFNLLGKKIPFLIDVDLNLIDIDLDSKTVNGEIKFLSANEYTIYWSWNIFSGKRCLIGENRNIFIKEDERTNEAVIEKVIKHICKTRWGREKVFSNFRWSDA